MSKENGSHVTQVKLDKFKAHFKSVDDPRINVHNQLHSLEDILLLTILAALCGADTWKEVESFGHAKRDWLKTFLELRNGIPSHDTLGRVFSLIDPEEFQGAFLSWVQSLANLKGEFLAIDGKTARRAYEKDGRKGALHMVNAWAVTNHMVFGQLRTAKKSNEITAIPELLNKLDLTGCTVSIDAMGTQTNIAETMTLVGTMEGKHSVDVGILVLPVIMETMMLIGDSAGVEYTTGLEEGKELDQDVLAAATIDKMINNSSSSTQKEIDTTNEEVIVEDKPIEEKVSSGLMARRV